MTRGFHVPPVCQGQIVEVAYACAGEHMLRRTHDRSDGSISYEIAEIGPDDWSWYETYEQANGEPPLSGWESISADKAAKIIDDLTF